MPTKRDIQFESGKSGYGELRCLKNFIKIIDAKTNKPYEIEYDQVLCALPDGYNPRKTYSPVFFKLNSTATACYDLRPYGSDENRKFIARYKWIPRKDGERPKLYTAKGRDVTYKNGFVDWVPEHDQFNVEFEILTGDFKGLPVRGSYSYQFDEDEDGSFMIVGHGKWYAGWAQEVDNLLMRCGFDFQSDNIPWSDDPADVLEHLDAILADRAKPVEITVVKGWVRDIENIADGLTIA
jgi:hypothetical protein